MTSSDLDTPNANDSTVTSSQSRIYGEKRAVNPLQRLLKSSYYSYKGIRSTFFSEQAFRLETYVLLLALPLSTLVAKSPLEYLLLIGSVVLVMIVELLNTGIELIVDRVSVEHHELSGRAKDAGSAAVFMTIFLSLACWIILAVY